MMYPAEYVIHLLNIWDQINNLNIYLNSSFRKSKSFLYNRGEFTDASPFFSQNILCPGSQYDDFCSDGSHTDLNTTVTIFC